MSKTRKFGKGLLVGAIVAAQLFTGAAFAQQASNLGTFGVWTAWKSADADGVICYISSQPQDAQPTNVNRDPIHFIIIQRKGLGTKNEVQTLVGYPLKTGSTPTATIDGKSYPMVIEGSAAWLASTGDEAAFVDGLKRGSEMVVKATSQRGTNTTDTYSLRGTTAASKAADDACAAA